VALVYGRAIQAIKRRHAEDIYLAPLGLNTDLLSAQQKEMSDSLMSALVSQMQEYRGEDIEALVVGVDRGNATIHHVDARGSVTCADDVGFAAIGIGAWHARSQLMQNGYTGTWLYFPALAAIFAAKKAADVSPGVGSTTDIHIAFRDQTERLEPKTAAKVVELYDKFVADRTQLAQKAVNSLIEFVIEQGANKNEQGKGQPAGRDAQADAGVAADAAEATQRNEAGVKQAKVRPTKKRANDKSAG
jgi:hypothetical protein